VVDVPNAAASVITPSTASTSVKRERSKSPVTEESGRDAKRANLGDMTNVKAEESSKDEVKGEVEGLPTDEPTEEAKPQVETAQETKPVLSPVDDNDEKPLAVSTEMEASAPR
jgi:hypothetical protein